VKALHPTLTLYIITAMLISALIILFYFSLVITDYTRSIMEYGSVRNALKDIAVLKLQDIIKGSRLKYQFSLTTVAFGYRKLDKVIEISIYNNTLIDRIIINEVYTLYASSIKYLVSDNTTLYGYTSEYFVNETKYIPILVEYNQPPGSRVELIICKVEYTVYNVSNGKHSWIVVKILIPRIVKPFITGKNTMYVQGVRNNTLSRVYENIEYFNISINGVSIDSKTILQKVGLNPSDIPYLTLDLIVVDIVFSIV